MRDCWCGASPSEPRRARVAVGAPVADCAVAGPGARVGMLQGPSRPVLIKHYLLPTSGDSHWLHGPFLLLVLPICHQLRTRTKSCIESTYPLPCSLASPSDLGSQARIPSSCICRLGPSPQAYAPPRRAPNASGLRICSARTRPAEVQAPLHNPCRPPEASQATKASIGTGTTSSSLSRPPPHARLGTPSSFALLLTPSALVPRPSRAARHGLHRRLDRARGELVVWRVVRIERRRHALHREAVVHQEDAID